ncbi:LysR family transcriptional regulator [Brucella intermedia]|uniref:LysR family transcriptional regulator n=1 Tax=Brucella intermedia TaxID=94625 RepID=UPI00224AEB74|nr:LysR family transcriptional regulator [Brucella intermedia]
MDLDIQASRRVNLKLLQTFLALAESGSFRETADQVAKSQSAVSTQIKLLEDQLGVSLFHRTTRSVRLTHEGELLLGYARRAILEVESGLRTIRELADLSQGVVSFACSPTIACTLLPPILAEFEKIHSGIRIVVHEMKSVDLFPCLSEGKVDFAIAPQIHDGNFDFRPVLRENIHVVVSEHLLNGETESISLSKLSNLPVIQFPKSTVIGKKIADAAEQENVSLNVRYECVQAQTLIALAKAGLGAALITSTVVLNNDMSGLRAPILVQPEITEIFCIVQLKGKALSPAAKSLASLIEAKLPIDALQCEKRRNSG